MLRSWYLYGIINYTTYKGMIKIIIEHRSPKYNPIYKKIYTLWHSMMLRCYNPNASSYHNYGGVGVTISEDWLTIDGFIETIDKVDGFDLERVIKGELQLDKDIKFENNKVYSYDRCKFVTLQQNSANRRNNKSFIAINLNTEEVILTSNREEFCRNHSMDSSTIWRMLRKNAGLELNNKSSNIYFNWVFQYENSFSMDKLPSVTTYQAVKGDNQILFTNQSKFAREHNLNVTSVAACIHGRQQSAGDYYISIHNTKHYKDSTTIERQLIALGVISETK